MKLDWSTFLLEIINFLVLVWILKRFLYKPVLNAIAQRKAEVQSTMSNAERLQREAHALREQYEHRLADWEQEKDKARSQMLEEVNAERTRLLDGLRSSLEQEREKARVLEERRLSELTRQAEEAAVAQGGQFAARLLSRLAGPELEARLVQLILDDLRQLPKEQQQAIRAACSNADVPVTVTSAYTLSQAQREALVGALQEFIGRPPVCEWNADSHLTAGVRVSIGSWMLRANLQDELRFFVEGIHHTGATHAS